MRRIEQKLDPSLKGKRWVLLKDRAALTVAQRFELDRLLATMTTTRTARAWQYREELREILASISTPHCTSISRAPTADEFHAAGHSADMSAAGAVDAGACIYGRYEG
jgi:hypothetical protein